MARRTRRFAVALWSNLFDLNGSSFSRPRRAPPLIISTAAHPSANGRRLFYRARRVPYRDRLRQRAHTWARADRQRGRNKARRKTRTYSATKTDIKSYAMIHSYWPINTDKQTNTLAHNGSTGRGGYSFRLLPPPPLPVQPVWHADLARGN